MLFYGECRVEVQSKTKGAQINVDGIPLGKDEVATQIPCGEKQIIVKKEGYLPYRGYITVRAQEPTRVIVELEKHKRKPNFAMSSQLVDQVRKGFKPVDPWGPDAGLLAKQEAEYQQRLAQAKSAPKTPAGGAASAGASSGASSGAAAGGVSAAELNSVDYWR